MQLDDDHHVCKHKWAPSNEMLRGQKICTSFEQNHGESNVGCNTLRA